MSRTAHHIPPKHGEEPPPGRPAGSPWHIVVLHDLRFSARGLADAERESNRPRPVRIRRRVEVHAFPRHHRDASVSWASRVEERRARQLLRARLGLFRALLHPAGRASVAGATGAGAEAGGDAETGAAAGAGLLVRAHAVDVDVPPARHRHGSLR
ncbi:hypothetical protein AB0D46_37425 [Streptomyces sp. NPDC048383]|uniref:hypothetical protein n=1 Tax=Streptomyces sp. NPDC048383 TaxID=3155386 RepID=UPI003421AB12